MEYLMIEETKTYRTTRSLDTGGIIAEEWFKNGTRDRADGPAHIERDPATGIVTKEEWRKDGKLDRADGPAHIERDPATGNVTYEGWWKTASR